MSPPCSTFSFKAPLPVPLVYSAIFTFGSGSGKPAGLFVFCFGFGLVVSALGTVALAITLWLMARAVQPPGRIVTGTTGTLLAAFGYVVFAWINYKSSGPDSGPPEGTFTAFLLRKEDWWVPVAFLLAGLVTSLLYDTLVRRFKRATA